MKRSLLATALVAFTAVAGADCPSSGRAQLAIIIDDIGYHWERGQALAALPAPITLSVIPATPHGKRLAEEGLRRGKEIMVHMPMSSAHRALTEPLALTSDLSDEDFVTVFHQALADIPSATGMNNHMGSSLTQDHAAMSHLMSLLKEENFFWVDSRTTADTVAAQVATAKGVPNASRAVFLDNERDPELIAQHLQEAVEIAVNEGSAIAIGHPYPETLQILKSNLPRLPNSVLLTPASMIARCAQTQSLTSIP